MGADRVATADRWASWPALIVRIAALAVLYVLAARLGLQLAFDNRNVTAVWPPTGIAVAGLVLFGLRVWPGIALGAFLANLANGAGVPMSAAIAVGNTLAPVVAAGVLRRLDFHTSLDRLRDVLLLFTVGAFAMTVSASAGTLALWLNDAIGDSPVVSIWLLWLIGDAFGVVLFAPLLILLPRFRRSDPLLTRPAEAFTLLIVSAGGAAAVFNQQRPVAFIISVPIVWAALRFEQLGTALVVVIVAAIAIAETVAGNGQFAFLSATESIVSLQIFNAAVGFASMVLAAVMRERTKAEGALRASEEHYRRVFEQASDLVCVHDPDGRLTYVNRATEQITGYPKDRLLAMDLTDLVAPESVRTIRRTIERQRNGEIQTATYEVEVVGTSGRRVMLEMNSSVVESATGPAGVHLIGRDITARRLAEDQRPYQVLEDPLTSLPNRTLLMERCEYALSIARRDGTQVALALIDLDDFRDVNTRAGHDTGDLVLMQLGRRLQEAFREPDTVARLTGDEFAVLAPSLAPGRTADVIAEQLQAELEAPFALTDPPLHVGASIGIALFPGDADDPDDLVRRADLARHDAKRTGGGRYSVYSAALDSQSMHRYTLSDELHAAVEERSFVLHYQPKIEVATMRTVGVECLLRWPHAKLGNVPPEEFIPLAATEGLMDELTDWILDEAIRQCATWNGAGFDLGVCVNLSAGDLNPTTASRIRAQLEGHDFPAERLTIEVAESDVANESSHGILERICSMGVRLSVDDFGTATSSMAHLSRLPISELKIDRSFVADISAKKEDRAVARSIVELAHNLGVVAVAEGVESREAWSVIEALGCDQAQGFLVCRPTSANELDAWLRTPAWSSRVR